MIQHSRCAVRAAWAAWLLVLFAATAMAVPASTMEEMQHNLVQQAQTYGDASMFEQSHEAEAASNSRRLLNRLLLEGGGQQQQGNNNLQSLYDMARASAGPDSVIIVDDSPMIRNQRRGAPAEEEIIVIPYYQPAVTVVTPVVAPPTTTPVIVVPTRPLPPAPRPVTPPGRQVQPGAYCIPRPLNGLTVLAAGDSITQGSVPSKNYNHPYTIRLKQVLEPQLQMNVRAVDAGLGGGGVFMTGFNVPVTFGPWLDSYMAQGPWSVVVIMIGINDLLRGSRSADDIMDGLRPMVEKVLAANTPVILVPPFAAPGFVSENDSKEAERRKLASLFRNYSVQHTSRSAGVGPQVWMLDLQANSPFNFYSMPQQERTKWLDDGLHLTELAYDTVGELVAEEIKRRVCSNAVTNN